MCSHYKTKAKLLAPCCNKLYMCKRCHNEKEVHPLVPSKVRAIICLRCNTKQEPRKECKYCDITFGNFACLKCILFDDFKSQYHCNDCGICRIGPKEHYFHCSKCNLCLNRLLEGNHKCIQNVTRDNCPICTEDLHSSRETLSLFECGHFMHKECFHQYSNQAGFNGKCLQCLQPLIEKQIHSIGNSIEQFVSDCRI